MLICILFRFPEDPEKRDLWIWLINLHTKPIIEWEESMKICAAHFNPASFTATDQLSDEAKPSLFQAAATLRKTELYVLYFLLSSEMKLSNSTLILFSTSRNVL